MHRTLIITLHLLFALPMLAQQSTWEPMNRGLLHTLVYTIEIDPGDSLRMYCGTDYGNIYVTTDGGFNWQLSREGIPENYSKEYVSALHRDRRDARILYAGFGGREAKENLFMSSDAGAHWQQLSVAGEMAKGGILHILRLHTSPPRLLCGLGWYNGIMLKRDSDVQWNRVLTNDGIQVIATHHEAPEILLAGSSFGRVLLRSVDGGDSWAKTMDGMAGLNSSSGVRAISFSPSQPRVVYVSVTGAGCGLHRSTDSGVTWTRLNTVGEISEIAIHPSDERLIYISAIGSGVWRTRDGGATWAKVNDGLPTTDIMRVRIAPGYPVRVFAVTLRHGMFRLVDEEIPE